MAENNTPAPGSMFGMPKYGTQRRFVQDNGNSQLGFTASGASQVNVPTTRLDQLDIVQGIKVYTSIPGAWTYTGAPQASFSPFFPANIIQGITFKLQAAYNTFNLTGPLASIIQAYRPMWGSRQIGQVKPDPFAAPTTVTPPATTVSYDAKFAIDIPFAVKFDEYFDLSAQGDPLRKVFDAIVTPTYMAAQARVVVPTITIAPQKGVSDLLGAPVAGTGGSFAASTSSAVVYRDAFWTANNVAANPPQYPWSYTRDFFQQPTSGQARVGVLIQNTGISVGQVLSLFGFVWDPLAESPGGEDFGNVVPLSSAIESIELVTGGSLQNLFYTPEALTDKMRSAYGDAIVSNQPDGVFVLDFALSEDGTYLSNADAINTYLVNGVQLNIVFKSDSVPSAGSTVYVGVEALKLVTS